MVWVDMDGVLADFSRGYKEKFGSDPVGQPDGVVWGNVKKTPDFFSTLPEMLGARKLWNLVEWNNAHVLTALSKSIDNCLEQKMAWLRRFGIPPSRVAAVTGKKNKPLFCRAGDILIDGLPENVAAWEAAGGVGVLYTGYEAVKPVLRERGL